MLEPIFKPLARKFSTRTRPLSDAQRDSIYDHAGHRLEIQATFEKPANINASQRAPWTDWVIQEGSQGLQHQAGGWPASAQAVRIFRSKNATA